MVIYTNLVHSLILWNPVGSDMYNEDRLQRMFLHFDKDAKCKYKLLQNQKKEEINKMIKRWFSHITISDGFLRQLYFIHLSISI